MSTDTTNPSPALLTKGGGSTWTLLPGLGWAAIMLGLLAWWLYVRDFEFGMPILGGVLVLLAGAVGLVAWCGISWYQARKDPAKLAELDAKMRPILVLAVLIGGGALLFLAVWLVLLEKMLAFAEASSMTVMGLIGVGTGLALRGWPPVLLNPQLLYQKMLANRKNLAITLMVVGAVLALAGVYLVFIYHGGIREFRSKFPGGPEGVGLFLLGLALVGGGLYTQLSLERAATLDTMRLLVLFVGSMTGFWIAFAMAWRIQIWWGRYIATDVATWQGENGWRFWVCIYLELFGLALLFGSLLLARVDIRVSVIMRRTLYGYNAVLTGLLLLVILVVLNIIVFVTLPSNVEWNRTVGLTSISESTANMLRGLKDNVKVYVLMQRYSESYLDVRDLLDNCQAETSRLQVEYLSPDLDKNRYRDLADKYPELKSATKSDFGGKGGYGRGLLVVYGPEEEKPAHTFIPDKDLEEADPGGSRFFKGEVLLWETFKQLSEKKQASKIYFTQGSGEFFLNDIDTRFDLDDRLLEREFAGAGALQARLRKENYEVHGLVWGEAKKKGQNILGEVTYSKEKPEDKHAVPADCKVLVIANPKTAFPKDVLEAIDRYVEKGGKILILTHTGIVLSRPLKFADDGMPELCKKFGVEVSNSFVIHDAPTTLEILSVRAQPVVAGGSSVAAAFRGKSFSLLMPRPVRPMKLGGGKQVTTILEVQPQVNGTVWVESTLVQEILAPLQYVRALKNANRPPVEEAVPVAVAVSDEKGDSQAVIIGDYAFVSTSMFQEEPAAANLNYDFFRSNLEWLLSSKIVQEGPRPRERKSFALRKDDVPEWERMIFLPLALMTLALAGTGAGVWIVRRK